MIRNDLNEDLFKKHPLEKALVAVGIGGLYVFLDYEGETIESELENVSSSPNDVIGDGTFPEGVGIYYWEGRPEWTFHNHWDTGGDIDMQWQDEVIRKATRQDLKAFGLQDILRE